MQMSRRQFGLSFNAQIQMLQAKNCANLETFCYGTFFKEFLFKTFDSNFINKHIMKFKSA
jgi:hypothetical protein